MTVQWKNFERNIAIRFRRWFPDARRGLQYQDGDYTPDIVKTPFYVECKTSEAKDLRYKKNGKDVHVKPNTDQMLTMYEYYYGRMKLWRDDGGVDSPVVIVWKLKSNPRIMVTMHLREWLEINHADPKPRLVGTNYLRTVTWAEFAEAMDEAYPVKRVENA